MDEFLNELRELCIKHHKRLVYYQCGSHLIAVEDMDDDDEVFDDFISSEKRALDEVRTKERIAAEAEERARELEITNRQEFV